MSVQEFQDVNDNNLENWKSNKLQTLKKIYEKRTGHL